MGFVVETDGLEEMHNRGSMSVQAKQHASSRICLLLKTIMLVDIVRILIGGKHEINMSKMRRLRGPRASARLLSRESEEMRELRLVSQRD